MADIGIKERITSARKAKKWTQKALADALNVNLKNVSRWELGSSAPSFEAAIHLSKVLGVSLDYLGGLDKVNNTDGLTALFNSKADYLSKEQKNALKTVLAAF
jgi:transcriptional regulator with XRE-family HTH domain